MYYGAKMSDRISSKALVLQDPDAIRIWDHIMQRGYNAQRLNDAELIAATERYAKRLGIKTPLLYISEEFPAIMGGKYPSAIGSTLIRIGNSSINNTPRGAIAFTREYLTMLGHTPHITKPSNELLFTLGHEMGHIKQGAKYMEAISKYPKLIGIGGAMAGVALLEMAITRAKKSQKEEALSDEKLRAALIEVNAEEHERVKSLARDAADSQNLHGILDSVNMALSNIAKTGEYLLAGTAGFIGGRYVTRQLVINAEFEADAIGAKLCGDPRAGIRCLQGFHDYYKKLPRKELNELAKKVTRWEAFNAYFDDAHPSMAKRFAALEKLAVEIECKAGKMAKNASVALGSVLERAAPLLSKLGETLQGVRVR